MSLLILQCIIFFFLGTIFGSFASVLIVRIKEGKGGIMSGRSECVHCQARLTWRELFPLFSYIVQRGKCRHCRTSIGLFYPFLELTMGIMFASIFLISEINAITSIFALVFLLVCGFIMVLTAFYDIRYFEVPDEVIVPGIFLLLAVGVIATLFPSLSADFSWYQGDVLVSGILGALIIYTFFYLQILIPGAIYTIQKRKWSILRDLVVWFFIFPFSLPFLLRHRAEPEKEEEVPGWVGAGDLRIALFMGLSLGSHLSIWALVTTYLFGSILGIIFLIVLRRLRMRIPFGPILMVGWLGSFFILPYTEMIGQILGNI